MNAKTIPARPHRYSENDGPKQLFTIQQTPRQCMVWCKTWDGRTVCGYVCEHRFQAALWIETAKHRQANVAR